MADQEERFTTDELFENLAAQKQAAKEFKEVHGRIPGEIPAPPDPDSPIPGKSDPQSFTTDELLRQMPVPGGVVAPQIEVPQLPEAVKTLYALEEAVPHAGKGLYVGTVDWLAMKSKGITPYTPGTDNFYDRALNSVSRWAGQLGEYPEGKEGFMSFLPRWRKEIQDNQDLSLPSDWNDVPKRFKAVAGLVASQIPVLVDAWVSKTLGASAGTAIGGPVGGVVGATAVGIQSMAFIEAGGLKLELERMGIDEDIADKYCRLHGWGAGAIEYIQQLQNMKLVQGKLIDPVTKKLTAVGGKVFAKVMGEVGSTAWEGMEEFSQGALSNVFKGLAMDDMKARHPEWSGGQRPVWYEGLSQDFAGGVAMELFFKGAGKVVRPITDKYEERKERKAGDEFVSQIEKTTRQNAIEGAAEERANLIGKKLEPEQEAEVKKYAEDRMAFLQKFKDGDMLDADGKPVPISEKQESELLALQRFTQRGRYDIVHAIYRGWTWEKEKPGSSDRSDDVQRVQNLGEVTADVAFDKTSVEYNQIWLGVAKDVSENIIEKNKTEADGLLKELATLRKETSQVALAKKKRIRSRIKELAALSHQAGLDLESNMVGFAATLADKAVERAKAAGLTFTPDREKEFREEFLLRISDQKPYVEQYGGQKISQVADGLIQAYGGGAPAAQGAPKPPAPAQGAQPAPEAPPAAPKAPETAPPVAPAAPQGKKPEGTKVEPALNPPEVPPPAPDKKPEKREEKPKKQIPADGAKAFHLGFERIPPMDLDAVGKLAWLNAWDEANLAEPVPEDTGAAPAPEAPKRPMNIEEELAAASDEDIDKLTGVSAEDEAEPPKKPVAPAAKVETLQPAPQEEIKFTALEDDLYKADLPPAEKRKLIDERNALREKSREAGNKVQGYLRRYRDPAKSVPKLYNKAHQEERDAREAADEIDKKLGLDEKVLEAHIKGEWKPKGQGTTVKVGEKEKAPEKKEEPKKAEKPPEPEKQKFPAPRPEKEKKKKQRTPEQEKIANLALQLLQTGAKAYTVEMPDEGLGEISVPPAPYTLKTWVGKKTDNPILAAGEAAGDYDPKTKEGHEVLSKIRVAKGLADATDGKIAVRLNSGGREDGLYEKSGERSSDQTFIFPNMDRLSPRDLHEYYFKKVLVSDLLGVLRGLHNANKSIKSAEGKDLAKTFGDDIFAVIETPFGSRFYLPFNLMRVLSALGRIGNQTVWLGSGPGEYTPLFIFSENNDHGMVMGVKDDYGRLKDSRTYQTIIEREGHRSYAKKPHIEPLPEEARKALDKIEAGYQERIKNIKTKRTFGKKEEEKEAAPEEKIPTTRTEITKYLLDNGMSKKAVEQYWIMGGNQPDENGKIIIDYSSKDPDVISELEHAGLARPSGQRSIEILPFDYAKAQVAFEAKGKEVPGAPLARDEGVGPIKQFNKTRLAEDLIPLLGREKLDKPKLIKYIAQIFGMDPKELVNARGYDHKLMEELFELAIILNARRIIRSPNLTPQEIFAKFVDIYEKQPILGERSGKSMLNQAYSTPLPVAYLMHLALKAGAKDVIVDPTAGNGMLLIGAKKAGGVELDQQRAFNAHHAITTGGSGEIWSTDFLESVNALAMKMRPTRIIANPPFGTLERPYRADGFEIRKLDHAIIEKALAMLPDDGRAAFIIGGHNAEKTQTDRAFMNWLYSHYRVSENIDVNGDLYRRQGTSYPFRILVVTGRIVDPNVERQGWDGSFKTASTFAELWKMLYDEQGRSINESVDTGTGQDNRKGPEATGVALGGRLPGEGTQGAGEIRGTPGGEGGGTGQEAEPGRVEGSPDDRGIRGGGDRGGGRGGSGSELGLSNQRPGETGSAGGELAPGSVAGERPGTEADRGVGGRSGAGSGGNEAGVPGQGVGVSQPGGVPGTPSVTAGELAKQAGLEAVKGVGEAIKGLSELFKPDPNTLGMGLVTNEETYRQAKPHFEAAWEHARAAGHSLADLVKLLIEKLGDGIRPYINRWLKERKIAPPEEGLQIPYENVTTGDASDSRTPRNIAQRTRKALLAIQEKVGPLDQFLLTKLGIPDQATLDRYFDPVQKDTLVLAINQIDQRSGIIVGHQTGVGKGRIAAALMGYALRNGSIPVFFTKSDNLFGDMFSRDCPDVGCDARPFIMNANYEVTDDASNRLFKSPGGQARSRIINGDLPPAFNSVWYTYSQIQNEKQDAAKRAFLLRLAEQKKILLVLDESHTASGETSITGMFIRELIDKAHGVVCLSATWSKRTDTMAMYSQFTDIMRSGIEANTVLEVIKRGGIPMLEWLSESLAELGQYVRAELDYSGVKIKFKVDSSKELEDTKMVDGITQHIRSILALDQMMEGMWDRMKLAVKQGGVEIRIGGGDIKGVSKFEPSLDHARFSSIVHNVVNQMLMAAKAGRMVDGAVAALEAGQKPALMCQFTMDSTIGHFVGSGAWKIGDMVSPDFSDVLIKSLEGLLRYKIRTGTGKNDWKYDTLPVSQLPPHIRAIYQGLYEEIKKNKLGIPAMPIDYLKQELMKRTYKDPVTKQTKKISVGEITGRKYTIDTTTNRPILRERSNREIKNKRGTINDWNLGVTDVLVYNIAGAEGWSGHARDDYKDKDGRWIRPDKRQRHLLIWQAPFDIQKVIQGFGRVFRKGQRSTPEYTYTALAIPTEIRPLGVLMRKLKSMNAFTSADEKSAMSIKEAVDFFNQYGNNVVEEFLRNNPAVNAALRDPLGMAAESPSNSPRLTGKKSESVIGKEAMTASGRAAIAPVAVQSDFFDQVIATYKNLIEELTRAGQNPLSTMHYKLNAKTLSKDTIYRGTDESNPFKSSLFLNNVEMDPIEKPLAKKIVQDQINANRAAHPDIKAEIEELWQKAVMRERNKWVQSGKAAEEYEPSQRILAQREQIENALKEIPIGTEVNIDTDNLDKNMGVHAGVVVNFEFDRSLTGNPLAPSRQYITVESPSGGHARFELSKKQAVVQSYFGPSILENWDTIARENSQRVTRSILTGNFLAWPAPQTAKGGEGTGHFFIIKYTDDAGKINSGILLSGAASSFFEDVYETPDNITKYLTTAEHYAEARIILDQNKEIQFSVGSRHNDIPRLNITFPRQYVQFYENPTINDLWAGPIYTRRSTAQGMIEGLGNIRKYIEWLATVKGARIAIKRDKYKKWQEEQQGGTPVTSPTITRPSQKRFGDLDLAIREGLKILPLALRNKVIAQIKNDIPLREATRKFGRGAYAVGAESMVNVGGFIRPLLEFIYEADGGTVNHEIYHTIQDFLLTDEENALIDEFYGGREQAANAFAAYAKNRAGVEKSRIRALFDRLILFAQKVRNYLRGMGYFTPEETFQKILNQEYKPLPQSVLRERFNATRKMAEARSPLDLARILQLEMEFNEAQGLDNTQTAEKVDLYQKLASGWEKVDDLIAAWKQRISLKEQMGHNTAEDYDSLRFLGRWKDLENAPPVSSPSVSITDPQYDPEIGKYAININMERLNVPEDVDRLIRQVAKDNGQAINLAKRGVVSWAETVREGQALGWSRKDVMELRAGKPLSDAENYAVRLVVAKSAIELENMKKILARSPTAANKLRYLKMLNRHILIQAKGYAPSSELGRALNANKLIVTGEEQIAEKGLDPIKVYQYVIKSLGGEDALVELADQWARVDINDLAQVNAFIRQFMKHPIKKKIYWYWINSILSSPFTHQVNMVSNLVFQTMSVPEHFLYSIVERPFVWFGKRKRQYYIRALPAEVIGMLVGIPEGIRAGFNGYVNAYDNPDSKLIHESEMAPVGKVWENIFGIPGKLLVAEDEMAKGIIASQMKWGMAIRKAIREKRSGQDMWRRVQELLADPSEFSVEEVSEMTEEMLYRTFQTELGKAGEAFLRWRDSHYAFKYMTPFVRTAVNISKRMIERAPGISLALMGSRAIGGQYKGRVGQTQLIKDIAHQLEAGLLLYLVATLFFRGKLTGRYPEDKEARELQQAMGIPDYALKVGEFWVPYGRVEPLGTIFGFTADMLRLALDKDTPPDEGMVAKLAGVAANQLINKTYLTGIRDAVNAAVDPAKYGDDYLVRLTSGFIPYSGLLRASTQATDRVIRQAETPTQVYMRSLPWLSEMLDERVNVLGDVIKRPDNLWSRVTPFTVTKEQRSMVLEELQRMNVLHYPQRTIRGEKIEYYEYKWLLSEESKRFLPEVIKLIRSKAYQGWDDDTRRKYLRKAISMGREWPRQQVINKLLFQKRIKPSNPVERAKFGRRPIPYEEDVEE